MFMPIEPSKPSGSPVPAGAPQAKAAEEKIETPKVEGFKLFAKQLKEPAEIIEALSTLSFLEVAQEAGYIAVLNVESRDIRRSPYLFSTIYLKPDLIEVAYSIVPGMSPRRRRIDVYRHLLNVLTLIYDAYEIDLKYLYQHLQSTLQSMTEFASSDYNDIFAKYDLLQRDYADLKKRADSLETSNAKVSKELIETRAKDDELLLRVKQLESYTDEALMTKLQDWLDVHRNELNVSDFAKQYGVLESRVEDVLNKMVIQGYLELRG